MKDFIAHLQALYQCQPVENFAALHYYKQIIDLAKIYDHANNHTTTVNKYRNPATDTGNRKRVKPGNH